MTDLTKLDPFTTIYRTFGTRSSRNPMGHRTFHLDPNCLWLKGSSGKKGRLGAQLAAGRMLCSYEAGYRPNLGGGPHAKPNQAWKQLERIAKETTS